MNLEDWEAGKIVLTVIGILVTWMFARPIRDRFNAEQRANRQAADAAGARAALDATVYRVDDDAVGRVAARAVRAETALDLALADKRRIAEEAADAITKIRDSAREDVHKSANWAMAEVQAAREHARTEIERFQHAAESQLVAAQAQHNAEMGALHDRVLKAEREIVHLEEQNRVCEASNTRLTREVEELRNWQQRSDVMGGRT